MSRVSELTFNASLLSELRAVEFVGKLIDQGRLPRGTGPGEFRRLRLHRVAMDDRTQAFDTPQQAQHRLRVLRDACTSSASARRGVSSTRISTTSAARSTIEHAGGGAAEVA